MSDLIDLRALLTVAAISFLGANALVVSFGLVLVGLGRYQEARSRDGGGTIYAALAVLAALACTSLLVLGFLTVVGG